MSGCRSQRQDSGASARAPRKTTAEAWRAHAARRRLIVKAQAALSLALAQKTSIEEWGPAIRELPAILDAPVTPIIRALFTAALPGIVPLISAKRQAQLEAACRRLDHYGGYRGAWIGQVCAVLEGWAAGDLSEGWLSEQPRSLGALAVELRREANMWRHGARQRRRHYLHPQAAARRRVAIKQWRRENRAATREQGRWAMTRPPHG